MEYKHTCEEITYELILNNVLKISIIDRSLCEEYSIIIDPNSKILNNHKIITNIKILYKIFTDYFEEVKENIDDIEKEEQIIQFACEKKYGVSTEEHCNSYIIILSINLKYISDSITLELLYINKHITPKQVIDRMEYKLEQYDTVINEKISEAFNIVCQKNSENTDEKISDAIEISQQEIMETIEKKNNDIMKEFTNIKEQIIEIKKMNDILQQKYDNIKKEFYEYIEKNLFMISSQHDSNILLCDSDKLTIYSLNNINGRIFSKFNLNCLKYFKKLIDITIVDTKFPNLTFLPNTITLQSVNIINNPDLISVKHLTKYSNLTKISIKGQCTIKDLHTLVDCPVLKELELPTGMNTGCFPTNIKFSIKMI